MDLSISTLAGGFVFGVLGFYVLKRGKERGDIRLIVIGLVLMLFSYFISNPIELWVIGGVLVWIAQKVR